MQTAGSGHGPAIVTQRKQFAFYANYKFIDNFGFERITTMLTTEVTQAMIEEWKRIFDIHHSLMTPNRKTGMEVDGYFRNKYSYQILDSPEFKKVVEFNIMENEHSRSKLPKGMKPDINTYCVENVLVGIDISSGEFCVECEDIKKAVPIYDDLFVYRGLDDSDLKNYFLVAEYVKLTQR